MTNKVAYVVSNGRCLDGGALVSRSVCVCLSGCLFCERDTDRQTDGQREIYTFIQTHVHTNTHSHKRTFTKGLRSPLASGT